MNNPLVLTGFGILTLIVLSLAAFYTLLGPCQPHPAFWGTMTIMAGKVPISVPHYYPEETCQR